MEHEDRGTAARAREGVAVYAVSVERRRPALRALRQQGGVRDAHHQLEGEVGHSAQRQEPAVREHAARRHSQFLPLGGDHQPEAGRTRAPR